MQHLMTLTATILRPELTGVDTYGDPIEDDVIETPIRCWVNLTGTDETSGGEVSEHATATLVAPSSTDLHSGDRLEVLDELWEVIGPPVVRSRPLLGATHIEATIRRRS